MDVLSKYEISNSCECRVCDDCGLGTESASCDNCGKDTRETSWCDGMCYEYKLEWLESDVDSWLERNGNPSTIRIDGVAMGWQRRDGYAIVKPNSKSLMDALTFNSDWTLAIEIDSESFKITRYSHDEPMGARFLLSAADDEESDGE